MRLCIYVVAVSRFKLPELTMYHGLNEFVKVFVETFLQKHMKWSKEVFEEFKNEFKKWVENKKELLNHLRNYYHFAFGQAELIERGIDKVIGIIEICREDESCTSCKDTYVIREEIKQRIDPRRNYFAGRYVLEIPEIFE